ncbi:hypothetical protein MTER_41270 [Mycolicibacter terrae]|uniref:Uncharacterized protein n=1 Tax=Mycolicibacter terrae TaxID=1788 RepID=A0AAD1MJC7_9MYCO|nr:hypothetical protein MTER_41270 [Mycolicibacter terrae]
MLSAKVSGCSMNTATACSIAVPVAAADVSMSLMGSAPFRKVSSRVTAPDPNCLDIELVPPRHNYYTLS